MKLLYYTNKKGLLEPGPVKGTFSYLNISFSLGWLERYPKFCLPSKDILGADTNCH